VLFNEISLLNRKLIVGVGRQKMRNELVAIH
jgi:hypothetical protein